MVILLGMAIRTTIPIRQSLIPGIVFCQKPLLRWAVAGLGFKLSLQELSRIGFESLAIVLFTTVASLFFGFWLGKLFKLPEKLSVLLSVGTSICGASAIVAADSVLQSEKSEVAASLGIITALGTIGILLFPPIGHALDMSLLQYSLWNGASLHEMAQVVAAGDAFSPQAAGFSTSIKLARITLLAPIVFGLAFWLRSRQADSGEAKVQVVPWFLVLFLVFMVVNSFVTITQPTKGIINDTVLFLLCVGMAGVGLQSGFQDIRTAGWKAVVSSLLLWLVLSILAGALAIFVTK